jgi:hypothetical protein
MVMVIVGGWVINGCPVEWPLIVFSSSLPPINKIIVVPLVHH